MTAVTVVEFSADVIRCMEHGGGLGGAIHDVPNDTDHVIGEPRLYAVGELETDQDTSLLELSRTTAHAFRVVGKRGGDAAWQVQLRPEGSTDPRADITVEASRVGLPGQREIGWTRRQGVLYLLVDLNADPPGHWCAEGGLQTLLARAAEEATRPDWEDLRRAAEGRRRWTEAQWRERFINPYTFVPFPQGLEPESIREKPAGHERLDNGRLSGWLDVRWRALTPLLIRGREKDGAWRFPTRPDEQGVRSPILPGSSLKGAIRSLHETMSGGCLRILDADYVPVYRDPARVRGPGWTLARIDATDDGRPTRLTLCDDVVWVVVEALHEALGGPSALRTGATVNLDLSGVRLGPGDRKELTSGAMQGEEWAILMTDAGARNPRHRYFAAVGHLSGPAAIVEEEAWRRYRIAVDGADDVRRRRLGTISPADRWAAVELEGQRIGDRHLARTELERGDVVWVQVEQRGGERVVTNIALSYLWRRLGDVEMGRRVPPAFLPCRPPEALCMSCRLFGSVDAEADARSASDIQRGYRGHVRFQEGRAVDGVSILEPIELAPMGAPRPGAGQMYLIHDGTPASSSAERPAREWGAATDRSEPRPLRGRKHYWHGDPVLQDPPRHRRRRGRPGQSDKMVTSVELADSKSQFESRIVFENISTAELGSLLCTLQPELVLEDRIPPGYAESRLALRLGGGKPFGLGTVQVDVLSVAVHSAASRYLDGPERSVELNELVDSYVRQVPEPVKETWPDLAGVLDVGHVDPRWIWYPPGSTWDAAGDAGFDEGFGFWKDTSGNWERRGAPSMPIPRPPRDPRQDLPIRWEGV